MKKSRLFMIIILLIALIIAIKLVETKYFPSEIGFLTDNKMVSNIPEQKPETKSAPELKTGFAQIYREFEVCMNGSKKVIDDDKIQGQLIAAECFKRLDQYDKKMATEVFAYYFDLPAPKAKKVKKEK